MSTEPAKLTKFQLFCYGITDMPLHFALTPVLIFVPKHYTAELGLSLFVVGNFMLLARVLDVVTDPLVGYWSDRTQTRWGRRRPWIIAATPLIKGLKLMWGNGPFKRLIASLMISSTAFNITTPLYGFFIAYVLGAGDFVVVMLAFFYTSNIIGVPFWVCLSKRIGKHRAYGLSFITIGCANPLYIFHGWGDFWWVLPITIISGFAGGAFASLPNSMKADVIDLDKMKSGDNRSASFFAAWSFTQKMSAALGGWIALTTLGLIGFDPQLGRGNSAEHMLGLRMLFTILPSILFFSAAILIWNYPITEKRHHRMRQALHRRNVRRTAASNS